VRPIELRHDAPADRPELSLRLFDLRDGDQATDDEGAIRGGDGDLLRDGHAPFFLWGGRGNN
jgi:hypothetical protein